MRKTTLIATAIAAALASGSVAAVEFNGYARAGTGISSNGDGDVSYEKNGVGRLGNEGDNYYEFGFAEGLQTGAQTWDMEAMLAKGDNGQSGWESDNAVNVAQFYVKAKGLFEFDQDAVLWAGKRYYQRKDIHISDFYFLNTSGTGGGIENISIGDQKLSVALIQDGETDDSSNYIADVRLANIGLWEDASLEVAAAYNFATEKDKKDQLADDGVLLSGIVHQNLSFGFNQTIIQYGTAGYGDQVANFGSGAWYSRGADSYNDASAFRIINWGVVSLGDAWEVGHQLSYHHGSDVVNGNADSNLYTAIVRPMYKWTDSMRTIAEAGIFAKEEDGKDVKGGHKFTLAQAWAMGNSFWARPEIRVYGSYITDEEGTTFGDKGDSDFVTGIQMEVWF